MIERHRLSIFVKSKNALLKLMQTLPFDAISVKDICEEAGFSRQYFYRYYLDKPDLIRDILLDGLQEDLEPIFRLSNSFRLIIAGIGKRSTFYKELFLSSRAHEFEKMLLHIGRSILSALVKTNTYYTLTDEQERSIDFYLHGIISTLSELVRENASFDPNLLTNTFLSSIPPCLTSLLNMETTDGQILFHLEKNTPKI